MKKKPAFYKRASLLFHVEHSCKIFLKKMRVYGEVLLVVCVFVIFSNKIFFCVK